MKKNIIIYIFFLVALLVFLNKNQVIAKEMEMPFCVVKNTLETRKSEVNESVIKEIFKTDSIKLIAFGDNLIHSTVYKAAKEGDTYNFDSLFEQIKDVLEDADIKVINQETILVEDKNQYSGYPTFGSPMQVGNAILDAKFNVVLQATNHAYDKKEKGILETIKFWKNAEQELLYLGIHESKEDSDIISVIEKNGIKVAMLNYTYSLNGFVLPKGKEYLVDTLSDKLLIEEDIKKAKEVSDVVVIFVHWGTEYVYKPTPYQKEYAQFFADCGADLIIGGHPHVVEPLEYINAIDGRTVPVYYSLGNFVSSQDEKPRMLGAMADILITKKDNVIKLECNIIPVVTHIERGKKFTTYLLEDYSNELAKNHKLGVTTDYLWDLWNSILQ